MVDGGVLSGINIKRCEKWRERGKFEIEKKNEGEREIQNFKNQQWNFSIIFL